jgi:nicotinamide riboside kinase
MRIAITGSAGSGKTTLGHALAERLNIAFLDDGLRRRIEAGLVFHKLDRAARKILLEELARENQAELALAERMHGGGVIERCSLDFMALWLYHGLVDDDAQTAAMMRQTVRDMAGYDAVIVLPWGVLPLIDDGVRAANRWVQLHFHALLKGLLLAHGDANKILYVPDATRRSQDRLNWVTGQLVNLPTRAHGAAPQLTKPFDGKATPS